MLHKTTTRITTDLSDPKLMMLLKLEAQQRGITVKQVIINALESYFAHHLETKALEHAAESVFSQWDNPLDADYDKL
ncbi:MAG: hypothetical protein JW841_04480 [Deltaproteobacteria bacterium]|nr:hypothetical protein [Deltaproteobacteria bacterium]